MREFEELLWRALEALLPDEPYVPAKVTIYRLPPEEAFRDDPRLDQLGYR